MASIYDLASSGADSAKDTNFATNYGFLPIIQTPEMSNSDLFVRGLTAYANMDKDEQEAAIAHQIFGDNLVDKKHAGFWVGEAFVNRSGAENVINAYIANNIPIPDGVTDPDQLTTSLGQKILAELSYQYDQRKAASEATHNRAIANFHKLINDKCTPADLEDAPYQEIIDATGYSPHDVYAAGRILAAREHQNILSQASSVAGSIGWTALDTIPRTVEALGAAGRGNFSQAARIMFRGSGSPYSKEAERQGEIAENAFANNLVNDSKFLALAKNPTEALKIVQAEAYKKEKQILENATMIGRMAFKIHDAAQNVYQGATDLALTPFGIADNLLGLDNIDPRQSQRVSAAVADAEMQARADVQDSRGILGGIEAGFDWGIENAALVNPYTAVSSTASLFRDNAGRGFNAIAGEDGSIAPSVSDISVYGKAASSTIINYLTRSYLTKYLPPKISKGLSKVGVNSSVAHFFANAGVTGTEFATLLPFSDGYLRWFYDDAYDAIFGLDPRLADGEKSVKQLAHDMQTPKHWLAAYTAGFMSAAPGMPAYHRHGVVLSEIAQCRGLSREEAETIRRSTPLQDQPKAFQDKLNEKLRTNPEAALDAMFENMKRINSEEQLRLKREVGMQIETDAAKLASLKMMGITLADGKDSNHVKIVSGGNIDPVTGKYIEGSSSKEFTREDAMLYLGAVFDDAVANLAEAMRNNYANTKIKDVLDSALDGKIDIVTMMDTVDFDKIIQRGKEAESLIEQRVKELVEKSKNEEGKPSLAESDARTQASSEINKSLHKDFTLADLVSFGKNAETRREQEAARKRNLDPDKPLSTKAFVVTKGSRDDNSLRRILMVTPETSTREWAEEISEMWLDDYMTNERLDITDVWRSVSALSDHIIANKPNYTITRETLTTLRKSNPELAKRLDEGLTTDSNISGDDLMAINKDVREAFSVMMLSNLRELSDSLSSDIADWARPLLNAAILNQHRMLQEAAYGKALNDAALVGNFDNTAMRLLGLTSDKLKQMLNEIQAPTVDTYIETYRKAAEEYQNLFADPNSFTSEQTDALLAEIDKADAHSKEIARQEKAAEEAVIDEAIEEASKDPANEGLTKEEVALKVDDEIMQRKQDEIAAAPNHVQDADAVNGVAEERKGKDGLTYRYMILDINRLEMLPNFKTGADAETGEVTKLTGAFRRDHDPVRVLRTTDGRLVLISGRHRFNLAKRHERDTIAAFVYEQNEHQTMEWAKRQDIEWNIADDQARPLDVALFIRGELLPELPPLDLAEVNRIGITRGLDENNFSANSMKGYILAVAATPDIITALRNEIIGEEQALYISLYAPLANLKTMEPVGNRNINTMVQLKGLAYAADGAGKNMTIEAMTMERTRQMHLAQIGNGLQSDWFGFLMQDDTYSNFVEEYSFKKRKDYAKMQSQRKAISDVAKRDYQTRKQVTDGTGLIVDAAAHSRSKNKNKKGTPQENIDLWKNPWLKDHMDVIGEEINKAFAEAYPEKWAEMQERKASEEAATANFSVIGSHAQTWQQYADRAFVGRDGLMRAELDSSQAKLRDGWKDAKTLDEALDFQELFEAYPEIKNLRFVYHKNEEENLNNNVSYTTLARIDVRGDSESDTPILNLYPEAKHYYNGFIGSILHEVQHFIQRIEGFADGSNLNTVKAMPNVYRGQKGRLKIVESMANQTGMLTQVPFDNAVYITLIKNNAKEIENEIDNTLSAYENAVEEAGNNTIALKNIYAQSLGEAEAHLVNSRQNLSVTERQTISFDSQLPKQTWNDIGAESSLGTIVTPLLKLARQTLGADKFNTELKKAKDYVASLHSISADFSVADLQAWQVDPTRGLGDLGHFSAPLLGKFAHVNDDIVDQKLSAFQQIAKRRIRELRHIHGNSDVNMIMGEAQALIDNIITALPRGYSFGREPYHMFSNVYSSLRKDGNPITAPLSLPMNQWPEIMQHAFRNQFERLLTDKMKPSERELFFELFDEKTVKADLKPIYDFYIDQRTKLVDEVKLKWKDRDKKSTEAQKQYRAELKKARSKASELTNAQFADEVKVAYQAIGEARLHRIMEKMLSRIVLKLDQYRKDRILAKINKTLVSITPRKQKDGKPVKGTVDKEVYEQALTARRLLLLTPTQKDTIDEAYQAKADKAKDKGETEPTTIDVSTFDESGNPIEFTVSTEVYNTYSCIQTMNAETAIKAQQALGTLVATGKQAWEVKANLERQQLNDFCSPIYQRYKESGDEQLKRAHKETLFISGGKGWLEAIRRMLTGTMNDAALIDTIAVMPGLEQFRTVQRRIASAHGYIEAAEKQNQLNAIKAALAVCGFPDADPTKLTAEELVAYRNFLDDINDTKALKDKSITLTEQAPNFEQQHLDVLRLSVLNRLNDVTKKKDFDANKLGVVINRLSEDNTMPNSLMEEVLAKYGVAVDPEAAEDIDMAAAMEYVFPAVKYGHMRNINEAIRERSAKSMQDWLNPKAAKLRKRLNSFTLNKDFNADEFVTVLSYALSKNLAPKEVLQPFFDKHIKIERNIERDLNGDEIPNKKLGEVQQVTTDELNKLVDKYIPISKLLPELDTESLNGLSKEELAELWKELPPETQTLTELTKNEAAYRVLLTEQTDLSDSLRKQGYTPEVVEQLKAFAGEKMMSFAYALRDLMNARIDTLQAIWEATYGTPFPAVENYFRAFFDAGTKESNDSQLEGYAFGAGGKNETGMRLFNTRIKHNAPIMPNMDVTHAFQIGMKQQDNLIAYSDPISHLHLGEFLRKVLANRKGKTKMSTVLDNALGKPVHAALVEHVENMYRIYGRTDAFNSAANRAVRDIGAAGAVAILAGRTVSLAKNVMAYFNTLGGSDFVNPLDWAKSAARLKLFGTTSHGFDISKDPLITDRFKEWDTETMVESLYQQAGVKSSLNNINRYARRGLSAFGAFDRWVTARSAAVMYDATYRKLQKQNPEYDANTLHTLSLEAAAMALGVKGQPLDYRQRPLMSTRNSFLTASYYFLGGEAWSTFGDCTRLAIKSIFNKNVPKEQRMHALANLAAVWLVNGFAYSALSYFFNALLDDEEHWNRRSAAGSLVIGSLFGPIAGMPIISNLASGALRGTGRLIGVNTPYISTPSYLPMADIERSITEFRHLWSSKASTWDKLISLENSIRNIMFLVLVGTQRPTSKAGVYAKSASLVGVTALNAIDFLLRLGRAADERW